MEPTIVIQGAGLAMAVLAMALETQLLERRGRTRTASARPSKGPQRCPFCHNGFAPEEEAGRCRACGTAHHTECWEEHGACTVMGCPSVEFEAEDPSRPPVTEPATRG